VLDIVDSAPNSLAQIRAILKPGYDRVLFEANRRGAIILADVSKTEIVEFEKMIHAPIKQDTLLSGLVLYNRHIKTRRFQHGTSKSSI